MPRGITEERLESILSFIKSIVGKKLGFNIDFSRVYVDILRDENR